ncbi:MAG: FeoA domain-containing protein [Pseudodesulfovibrio sp.]|nr:FeoA domain-containing protein [Pseudodesulfovibrio sp.]
MSVHKTLKSVSSGETAFIIGVAAGRRARYRLESMGIFPGIKVDVLNNGNGPMIVSVGEGRVMVECGIAQKVLVA